MKKYAIAIIIAIIIAIATTASADTVDLLLAGDNNRVCGIMSNENFKNLPVKSGTNSAEAGGLGKNGCLLREKAVIGIEDARISNVEIDKCELVNQELLEKAGFSLDNWSAASIIAETVETTESAQVHRMVGYSTVKDTDIVVDITIGYCHVWVVWAKWDGTDQLCLVAGPRSAMGYDLTPPSHVDEGSGAPDEGGTSTEGVESNRKPVEHSANSGNDGRGNSSSSSNRKPVSHSANNGGR